MLKESTELVLGADPANRQWLLNGTSAQQDILLSFRGWQYTAFYASVSVAGSGSGSEQTYVHLARRLLTRKTWDVIVFEDYPQVTDDGHNTIQIGICRGDGTIHLAYDHHSSQLHYRFSQAGVATDPEHVVWDSSIFTTTLDTLPGTVAPITNITYPRFLAVDQDMMFSYRTGMAGLGSEELYTYSSKTGKYVSVGIYLEGNDNNPYINGLDYFNSRLHVTWTYRDFVPFEGWDKSTGVQHKQQAGPNGIENNHDLWYSYSDDLGRSWKNDAGSTIAELGKGGSVRCDKKDIKVFSIPKGCGAHNQEDQVVDHEGGVHVLNRDTMDGHMQWKHYYRTPQGTSIYPLLPFLLSDDVFCLGVWGQSPLPNVTALLGGKRGVMAVTKQNDIYFVLPENRGTNSGDKSAGTLTILKATKGGKFVDYELVWTGGCYSSEPRVDRARLHDDNVLSLYLRRQDLDSHLATIVVREFDVATI